MTRDVLLPQLAEGMTDAKVTVWLKREGQAVTAGEPLAEIETDKTNVELEAPASGVLERITVQAGSEGVAVGTVLAVIALGGAGSAEPAPLTPVPTTARPEPREAAPVRQASPVPSGAPAAAVDATPLAARMADLAGLDLESLTAESVGPITKARVEAALTKRSGKSSPVLPEPRDTAARAPLDSYDDQPLSAMRRVTAVRMQQAKQTIPHFYLEVECHVDALMAVRRQINEGPVAVSVTDMLVLAASRVLVKVPTANACWEADALRVYDNVDIAVAVDTPKGLIAPIVRGAQRKSLAVISRELQDLAARARLGRLTPDEYTGGTFTISNLGMFGASRITPIINPPQVSILGVGAIEQRPVVEDGRPTVGHLMSCTLAADHRAIDGATGAQFLTELRRLIEHPASIVLYL